MFYYLAAVMAQFHNWRRSTPGVGCQPDFQSSPQDEKSTDLSAHFYGYEMPVNYDHAQLSMYRLTYNEA